MAIIKTIKIIGKIRKQSLMDNLTKKQEKINRTDKINQKVTAKKYKQYKVLSTKLISQTIRMLSRLAKEPKLKNAEFVFLDRDALPYMYTARELCSNYGFNKTQFKSAKITNKAEQQMSTVFEYLKIPEESLISIKSNGKDIDRIAQNLPNTSELKNLKTLISQEIDLTKPIVVIDSGYRGTAVKKYQLLLKAINPSIETYSSMFFTDFFARSHTDYIVDETRTENIVEIENTPKFTGKLLQTQNQKHKIKIKRQNRNNPDARFDGGFSEPVSAEIFMIALRNTLAKYKHDKEKK